MAGPQDCRLDGSPAESMTGWRGEGTERMDVRASKMAYMAMGKAQKEMTGLQAGWVISEKDDKIDEAQHNSHHHTIFS